MTTEHAKPPEWRNRDLDDRAEIAEMVRRFYFDVAQDALLGPMFNDVARVDWGVHVPKLVDFWCRTLLSQPGYSGNPYRAHLAVHAERTFTAAQFERWLDLFHETVDLGWAGPYAEHAKAFGRKVAAIHSKQLLGDAVLYVPGELDPGDRTLSIDAGPADLPVDLPRPAAAREPEGGDPACWAHLFEQPDEQSDAAPARGEGWIDRSRERAAEAAE